MRGMLKMWGMRIPLALQCGMGVGGAENAKDAGDACPSGSRVWYRGIQVMRFPQALGFWYGRDAGVVHLSGSRVWCGGDAWDAGMRIQGVVW